MADYMKVLMERFYTPTLDTETDRLQHSLGAQLNQEQRRQLLRIIDMKNAYCETAMLDSFIAGFRLAVGIAIELSGDRRSSD